MEKNTCFDGVIFLATMDDIARRLGISKGTVSKAFSGAEDVSEAMRRSVLETAVELGYTRQLRSRQAPKICVFIENMAYEHPDDLEARDNMLLAANIAMGGMADVGVQFGHGIGQALGAYTHAPHGVTCAWALPYVIEHLYDVEAAKVRQIADAFALDLPADASPETVRDAVEQLSADVHLPMPHDLGCTMEKDYDNFVKFVLREQRLIQMSAKHVSDDDVRRYMTDLMTRAH